MAIAEVTSRGMKATFVEAFRIPSASMAPTILVGDFLFATTAGLLPLDHGRLIVYRSVEEDREGQQFVHRLVGLPNDTLAMANGTLIRNGQRIAEPYAVTHATLPDPGIAEMSWQSKATGSASDREPEHPIPREWGPLVVPPDHVFVLGDTRNNSRDSRYIGFIPVDNVEKRARRIYWSRDPYTGAIRWERIGRDLE